MISCVMRANGCAMVVSDIVRMWSRGWKTRRLRSSVFSRARTSASCWSRSREQQVGDGETAAEIQRSADRLGDVADLNLTHLAFAYLPHRPPDYRESLACRGSRPLRPTRPLAADRVPIRVPRRYAVRCR